MTSRDKTCIFAFVIVFVTVLVFSVCECVVIRAERFRRLSYQASRGISSSFYRLPIPRIPPIHWGVSTEPPNSSNPVAPTTAHESELCRSEARDSAARVQRVGTCELKPDVVLEKAHDGYLLFRHQLHGCRSVILLSPHRRHHLPVCRRRQLRLHQHAWVRRREG